MKLISRQRLESLVKVQETDLDKFSYDEFLKVYQQFLNANKQDYAATFNTINKNYLKLHSQSFQSVGVGSGRAAYAIFGGKCLKIAINARGIAQNKQEVKTLSGNTGYSCFTAIYDYDSKNNSSLLTECCAKATEHDFVQSFDFKDGIEGLTDMLETLADVEFDVKQAIQNSNEFLALYTSMKANGSSNHVDDNIVQIEERLKAFELLQSSQLPQWKVLRDLVKFYVSSSDNADELDIGDLLNIGNWGMAIRNGKIVPVIIDAGLSTTVNDEFYQN